MSLSSDSQEKNNQTGLVHGSGVHLPSNQGGLGLFDINMGKRTHNWYLSWVRERVFLKKRTGKKFGPSVSVSWNFHNILNDYQEQVQILGQAIGESY